MLFLRHMYHKDTVIVYIIISLYFCGLEIMEIFNKCLPSIYFTHNHL